MSEKKVEKQAETAAKQPEKRNAAVIYLGPAIAGVAVPGTVYNNGLTTQMAAVVKEAPAIKKLLVEVQHTGQVRKEIRDPNSAAGICYQQVLDYVRKRGVRG